MAHDHTEITTGKGHASDVVVPAHGPIVSRLVLGIQLRRLRESRGISARQAARVIGGSESKISRIELGRSAVREIDVLDLLRFYGVGRVDQERLLALTEQANRPGWWHRYGDVLPGWFQTYLGLEEAASSIRVYEPRFIPGLLQTERYATAVMALGGVAPAEAARRVAARLRRQRRLSGGDLTLWAVVDEMTLRCPVGDRRVGREQLRHLLDILGRPNVTVQVVPYDLARSAAPGGFSILRFDAGVLPDIVYVEHLTGALYLDKRSDVDRYTLAMQWLSGAGASPDSTPGILTAIIRELGP